MTNLHAYFYLRNLSAFRQLLDARAASGSSRPGDGRPGSGPRSWSQQQQQVSAQMTAIAQNVQLDNNPNARDAYGRTVLHVACADVAPVALEFVRALLGLAQTQIDVNAQDTESGWTALHRAFYAGNLPAAILLLGRADIDTGVRDLEGMTSFDVYNATVEGTAPDVSASAARELLVWGSNRNATLGVGDANDRTYPEAIRITRPDEVTEMLSGSARFSPITVKGIAMSRLHTTVLTSEPRANLEACGFGGVGRLGTKHHAQYSLSKISGLENQTITSIALGLDHTLALTQSGDVLSWGFNRFHQLGYIIEPPTSVAQPPLADSSEASQVQVVPKRVLGPIRKEIVVGVAACKTASVCWTGVDLYSWGTNAGQLGYPKGTPGWQVLPRKVALVSKVIDVAISDKAMACLLETKDVMCFWNNIHFKVQFASPTFPHRYRPPQPFSRTQISKITSTDTLFAALSTSGEVFLFTPPDDSESSPNVRPQKVWTLRRSVAGVRDVAVGGDGTVIVCTVSGHVFVRVPRAVKGAVGGGEEWR